MTCNIATQDNGAECTSMNDGANVYVCSPVGTQTRNLARTPGGIARKSNTKDCVPKSWSGSKDIALRTTWRSATDTSKTVCKEQSK